MASRQPQPAPQPPPPQHEIANEPTTTNTVTKPRALGGDRPTDPAPAESVAVANPKEASASAAVSVPAPPTSSNRGADPARHSELSQPSVVVQGTAARSSRPAAPRQPSSGPSSGSLPAAGGLPTEVAGAPAAVQAAALRVAERHQFSNPGHRLPDPQTNAGSPEGKEESSSAHLIALKAGTVINGRYRIERMLGRGGMGTVYLVRHTNTEEKLALKLLHPALAENEAAVQRFRTEARAPVRIESEHVVRVVDADVCEKLGHVPFMVMERLKGHDLRSELKRRGALPAGEVVLYLSQVARALDKAHEKGIIHRDLKPANMYVVRREDGSPLVKVLDFGIAKLTDDAAKELTVAGQVFGTPWYMAPEQARGELGAVGPATDLWALGLIAYQLLTGMNYWTADGMAALVGQICYEPMPPPTQRAPHLGPLFDMWFSRACNRDPSQRFSSAKELVAELAQALGVNHSAALVTASGEQRNFDSSLQMQAGAHLGQSGSNPGMAVAISGHPVSGTPVPGTAIVQGQGAAADMDPSNPLFYTTQQAFGRKQSSTTAVLLGVVIALAVGVTGLGVWLLMPPPAAQTVPADGPTEGEDPAAAGERGGPPAAVGTGTEDGPEEESPEEESPEETATPEPTDEGDEDKGTTAGDDEAEPKTAAKDPPKPQPKKPAAGPPSKWTPPPKPATKPPAPSVGDVTF